MNDFKVTIGDQNQDPWENPVCVETTDYTQIVDNQITIECPTVMRGGYVTFKRNLGGLGIAPASLCEVVVMGRIIISNNNNMFKYHFTVYGYSSAIIYSCRVLLWWLLYL